MNCFCLEANKPYIKCTIDSYIYNNNRIVHYSANFIIRNISINNKSIKLNNMNIIYKLLQVNKNVLYIESEEQYKNSDMIKISYYSIEFPTIDEINKLLNK